MNKSKLFIFAVATSFSVLFFQNCGQTGSIALDKASMKVAASADPSGPGLVIVPPVQPQPSTPPVASNEGAPPNSPGTHSNPDAVNPPAADSDHIGDHDQDNSTEVADSDDDSDDIKLNCGNIAIADVLLQIRQVEIGAGASAKSQSLTINAPISIHQPSLKFKSTLDQKGVSQVRIILGDGSQILTTSEQVLNLKTPSAEESGLKVHLDSAVDLEKGKTYTLILNIDESQLKVNGDQCMFHPVIKSADIKF